MKRLRHPIRAIREPFGTAGLIVACVALVAALGGTAFAAAKLNSTQKKEVEKIAKKFAGKPGAAGANGTNGTNGSPGAKGDVGTAGTNGTNGESVTVTPIASPGCNGQAGVKFKNATGEGKACNGTSGFTKTLPSEETEFGTWVSVIGSKEGFFNVEGAGEISTSFNIPLSAALTTTGCNTHPNQPTSCQVHLINEAGEELVENFEAEPEKVAQRNPEPCPGTAEAPEAEPGNLCIYIASGASNIFQLGNTESSLSTPGGIVMQFLSLNEGKVVNGTWAVTAG